ncbi:hypothetical protein CBS147333_9307 [Penicillium roqueforti]|uniref:Uncharacterized protein n=1 Tax=Penicillium salamii TaxID=1612424 RepID=A0A9W4J6C5_9EURO|nr:hypothetical protein HAV15_010656 [Penicillium sp. str. \
MPPDETTCSSIDEGRRKAFSQWFSTASFEAFAKGVSSCNDRELGRRVWTLLVDSGVYEEGFEYSAWRTEASSQFKSKAGSGDLIVISGTPRVGQGRPLPLGSITRVCNEDVIHPPMDCIYVSSATKKK